MVETSFVSDIGELSSNSGQVSSDDSINLA